MTVTFDSLTLFESLAVVSLQAHTDSLETVMRVFENIRYF